MAHWKDLEGYTPFARMIVEYMWAQRPPLLPSQFAVQMGIPKQVISKWLNAQAEPDPRHLLQLAERMSVPVQQLFLAAGYTTPEHPLLSRADAIQHVLQVVRDIEGISDMDRAITLKVLDVIRSHIIQSTHVVNSESDDREE
jgi:transcriptional regulator with XRE-family HTH domain